MMGLSVETPKTVQEGLPRIREASDPLGLSINSEKCGIFTIPGSGRDELWDDTQRVLESIQQEMPKIRMVHRENYYCLGLPSVIKQLGESYTKNFRTYNR